MKLIIDIPERYYEFCRECIINKTDTVDQMFIANGVEYVEPKKGKWIEQYPFQICNQCGKGYHKRYNFCPNCGAKMEVDNENYFY